MNRRCLAVAAVAALSSLLSPAVADTITVCESGCDFSSINAAIAASNDGDVIQLQAEIYLEGAPIDTLGKQVRLLGKVDKDGTILTIISANGGHQLVRCATGETEATRFENLILADGYANNYAGGEISGDPVFSNCVIRDCYSNNMGGIRISGSPTFLNCRFEGNRAKTHPHFYIYITGSPYFQACSFVSGSSFGTGTGSHVSGPTSFVSCEFLANSARSSGGAVYLGPGSSGSSFEDCTFVGNSSYRGGAVFLYQGDTVFKSCLFEENFALDTDSGGCLGARGGAIASCDSTLVLEECRIQRNTAPFSGGGLAFSGGVVAVEAGVLCGNLPDQYSGDASAFVDTCFSINCSYCDPDSDGDGVADHEDVCPGQNDRIDTDSDGVPDCLDGCPNDPNKTDPGRCGCGSEESTVQGDFNCDGVFDLADYAAMGEAMGTCPGDLNGDGEVSGADMGLLLMLYGTTCS